MKHVRILLLLALAFCAEGAHAFDFIFGRSPQTIQQTIPQWVANPVADDAEYMYGVGEGESLAKAVQSALNTISGKLATVVSSNISAETTLNQGKVSGYFSQQVESKTLETKLSGYEVVQSDSRDGHFYALVKMSRRIFVNDTLARLKSVDDRLNNRVASASQVSKLQHYLALHEIKPDLSEATALVMLLQAASPQFESEKYLSAYRKYLSDTNEMLYRLKFKVEAESAMSGVADIVVRMLSGEKLSASTSRRARADAVIAISGKVQNKIIYSEYNTQLRVRIQVSDETGRNVNTEEYVVAGGSLSGFEASTATATGLLQKELENAGILVLLGLHKNL